jgi:hypothetical protein
MPLSRIWTGSAPAAAASSSKNDSLANVSSRCAGERIQAEIHGLDDVVRVDDHADGQLIDATRADPRSDLERCALEEQAPERAHPRLISVGRPTEVGPRLHLGLVGRLERDPLSWRDQRLDLVIRGSDEKHAEHVIPVGGVENVELVEGDPHGCGHAAKLRRDGDAVCSRWATR